MTNAEKILELLEVIRGPACDDCISLRSGVRPRQQVNQICRRLEGGGAVLRQRSVCVVCKGSKQTNSINKSGALPPLGQPGVEHMAHLRVEDARNHLDRFCKALCERQHRGRAADNLADSIRELSDQGVLPIHQANMMHTIRSLRNAYVHEQITLGKREYAVLESAWSLKNGRRKPNPSYGA